MADTIIPITTIAGSAPQEQIFFYTQFELYKIWFSTAMLVIAIFILTFIVYRWQRNQYKRYMYEQDVAEARASGKSIANIPVPVYKKAVNKPLILAFGVFIVVAGIIQFIM